MSITYTDGEESSTSKFLATLASIRETGQQVLDDLAKTQTDTLFRFQQGLSALNSRRQRASRILSPDVAAKFVVSDFLDVDQGRTSATVRVDSGSVVLKEKRSSFEAPARTTTFTSATGTTELLNQMYRVHVPDGTSPTGVFDIQLTAESTVTMIVFDMVMMPSDPDIQVHVSQAGISWTAAQNVSKNGYRVNAYLAKQPVKYIRISITPSHPDSIGGTTFTFGLTDFQVFSIDYYLYSELITKPVSFVPVTDQVRFRATETDVEYFLAFGDEQPFQVSPGDVIVLPGVEKKTQDTQINTDWVLCPAGTSTPLQLPADVYPSSLKVLDVDLNQKIGVAWGMDPALAGSNMVTPVVAVKPYINSGILNRLPVNSQAYSDESGRTFRVTYSHGPQEILVRLEVHLSSRDKAVTPLCSGAWLEHVFTY